MVVLNGDLSLYALPNNKKNSVIKSENTSGAVGGGNERNRKGSRTYSLDGYQLSSASSHRTLTLDNPNALSSAAAITSSSSSSSSSSSRSSLTAGAVTPTSDQWQSTTPSSKMLRAAQQDQGYERSAPESATATRTLPQPKIPIKIVSKSSSNSRPRSASTEDVGSGGGGSSTRVAQKRANASLTPSKDSGSHSENSKQRHAAARPSSSDTAQSMGTEMEVKYELAHPNYQAPASQNGVPFYGSGSGGAGAGGAPAALRADREADSGAVTEAETLTLSDVAAAMLPFPTRVRSASIGGGNGTFPSAPSFVPSHFTFAGNNDTGAGQGGFGIGTLTSQGRVAARSRGNSLDVLALTDRIIAQRIHADLVSTLNHAFPDYDFSQTKLDAFKLEDTSAAIVKVGNYLSEIIKQEPMWLTTVWNTIDTEIKLSSCRVYSYVPDMEGDPFSDQSVWSFNFFFVDSDSRKVALFTCIANTAHGAKRRSDRERGAADSSRELAPGDGDIDYRSTDDDGSMTASPRSNSPSPYGAYGSPREGRAYDWDAEAEEEECRGGGAGRRFQGNIAVHAGDESDSSCDDM
jgi:hypothetical protein